MTTVLWLSRHEMTNEQAQNLADTLAVPLVELVIVGQNLTFPAVSGEAIRTIMGAYLAHDVDIVAGVFPAHIAARWAATRTEARFVHADFLGRPLPELWIPVSVPAPAKEGETRGGGFVFSHWEAF